jgi:Uma2 family endonuclease
MAATTLPTISVEEYITRYVEGDEKPACEYVDGELIQKPTAGKDHSRVQRRLIVYLSNRDGGAARLLVRRSRFRSLR